MRNFAQKDKEKTPAVTAQGRGGLMHSTTNPIFFSFDVFLFLLNIFLPFSKDLGSCRHWKKITFCLFICLLNQTT